MVKNSLVFCCLLALALASQAYCRSIRPAHSAFVERDSDIDLLAEASKNRIRVQGSSQGRILPNPVVAKKLLLLKFKKLIPISLILLRSENGEDAELVPVYESSLVPSNVDFINTPGGLNGHEDVQAIGIPTELANKNEITEALQVVAAAKDQINDKFPTDDDEPLNVNEDDDQQVLVVDTSAKPSGLRSTFGAKERSPFEETSLYLYPYQENRGTKQTRRNLHRYHN